MVIGLFDSMNNTDNYLLNPLKVSLIAIFSASFSDYLVICYSKLIWERVSGQLHIVSEIFTSRCSIVLLLQDYIYIQTRGVGHILLHDKLGLLIWSRSDWGR